MCDRGYSRCVIEGTVDGLPPGHHALCVHECGDISDGCNRLEQIILQPGNHQFSISFQ